ncbi:MAG: hypothetical protein OIF57_00370 [Marinobacterium sp.]|nr:hypothetical protein [Marinobacterium sp.]
MSIAGFLEALERYPDVFTEIVVDTHGAGVHGGDLMGRCFRDLVKHLLY